MVLLASKNCMDKLSPSHREPQGAARQVSGALAEAWGRPCWPRLHVLSDLHLESGDYAIAPDLDFDILVAAGDIGPVDIAVPWLARVGKPVVYVLGNHDQWGSEFTEVARRAKALANGTQVHVLARNAVELMGVRFLGTTLWTSYGNWHPDLVMRAARQMRDHANIQAQAWWSRSSNAAQAQRLARKVGLPGFEPGRFCPAIAYLEHQRDVQWLSNKLVEPFDGPTVVVTHHAPSFACLKAAGVTEDWLDPASWRSRETEVVRVAAYASPLLEGPLKSEARDVDLWVHGHLHAALETVVQGARVVCNPRGRVIPALTHRDKAAFGLFGHVLSDADIERSQSERARNPYRGEVHDFDARRVIELTQGLAPAMQTALAGPIAAMDALIADCSELLPHVRGKLGVPSHAVERTFAANLGEFRALTERIEAMGSCLDAFGSIRSRLGHRMPHPFAFGHPGWLHPSMTLQDFEFALSDMRDWRNWSEALPNACADWLDGWARCSLLALTELDRQGIPARVVPPPLDCFRKLPVSHLEVCVPDSAQQSKATDVLDALLNKPGLPRDVLFFVTRTPLRPMADSHLLDAEQVRCIASLVAAGAFGQ